MINIVTFQVIALSLGNLLTLMFNNNSNNIKHSKKLDFMELN